MDPISILFSVVVFTCAILLLAFVRIFMEKKAGKNSDCKNAGSCPGCKCDMVTGRSIRKTEKDMRLGKC